LHDPDVLRDQGISAQFLCFFILPSGASLGRAVVFAGCEHQASSVEADVLKMMVGASLAGTLALTAATAAQDWPRRPITMVVPFASGGTTDVLGRIMAQRVGEILGQQVVVENIGGSGGMIGSLRVAQSPPDGSQLLFSGLGPLVVNQVLYKKPLYHTLTDFAPVALLAEVPLVLIVRKDLPIKNLQEFIAYTKVNQENMSFASAGIGSAPHIGCVLLNMAMNTNVIAVPYRGSGPAMQDLIAGRTDFFCEALPTALPQIESGAVKAIAILTRSRAAVLPSLQTAQEQGLANFEAYTWFGFFFPRGTPDAIVHRLQQVAVEAAQTRSLRERVEKLGAALVTPERMTSESLSAFVRSEIEIWTVPI
jgi:tripartite-type tricarboxylate transporter receptor subunit TctC